MTAPAVAAPSSRTRHLAGTATLVRFMLRRDRVKLPAWAGGLTLFVLYLNAALPSVAATEEDLVGATALFADPVGRMVIGPGYGFEAPTYERFVAGGYGLYFLIASALMSIFLIVRHTRVEEQTGRAELVRANVVGRHAPLTAALIVAGITNAAVGLLVFLSMVGVAGFAVAGSFVFAVGLAVVGMAFAGIATVTVQLSEYSRAASGMAGAVLGASFVIRGGGDMAETGGTALSWIAPLAWGQQTAPFVLDRWWPLLLPLALAVLTATLGYVLSARRDLAASRFAARPGRDAGAASLGTPFGLARRLQRASIIGWGASLTVAGMAFGAFSDALVGTGNELPEVFQELFSAEDMLSGYLGYMAVYMAYFVGAYVIMAVQGLRKEETVGRLEPVLATPMGRWMWLGSNLLVTAIAAVIMLVVVGAATGLGATIVTGDAHHIPDLMLAHVNHAPAVLVVLGIATMLYGAMPRAVPVAWVVVVYGLIAGSFGPLLDVGQMVLNLSPFAHLAGMPLEPFLFTPVPILLAVVAGTVATGMVAFRRRDLTTT